jgi:hypothetical protein
MPYSHLKSLYSITGIAVCYVGVLVGDSFYASKRKTIPMWFLDIKMKTTFLTLTGIGMLLYGVFMFPTQTRPVKKDFPPSTAEIYAQS